VSGLPERTLDEQIEDIRADVTDRFGRFLTDSIAPGAVERDRTGLPIPRELLGEAATLGLLRQTLPLEAGGEGADALRRGVTLELVSYLGLDQSFSLLIGLFEEISQDIALSGRPELVDRYADPLVRGDLLGAFGYSDGTDPFSFKSTARPVDGGYELAGYKSMVTGAALADLFVVYVAIENGDLGAFIVERSDPGVTVTPRAVSGVRAAGIGSLTLEAVRVPAWRVLYEEDGLSHAQRFLNSRRALHSSTQVGGMHALLDRTIAKLHSTIRYGAPLTDASNVQASLGRMYAALETARSVTYHALSRSSSGVADAYFDPVISAAKHTVTELSIRMAIDALRLTGGDGYASENHFERWLRDFTGLLAGAGAQDTLEMNLGTLAVGNWEALLERSEER
jgi:acyl-CoA dehydrogenase